MTDANQKKALLDSDSESDSEISKEKNNKKSVQFSINTKFAQDYQSRKQREELQRERERRGDWDEASYSGSSSSESSEEDEDAVFLTPQLDVDILKTINALRSKDKRIYDPNARFFPGSDEESEDGSDEGSKEQDKASKKEKKNKPKRAKDVIREQILEQIEEGEAGDDDKKRREELKDEKTARLAYDEQQQELRKAFLDNKVGSDQENDDDDSEDDFLVIKKRHNHDSSEMDEEAKEQFEKELQKMEGTVQKKDASKQGSSLVDPRGEVEDGEKFLLDFIKNKSWVDKSEEKVVVNSDDDSDDDSLEQLEKTDEFEHQYNFRFEEAVKNAESTSGAEHSVMGYARSQTMNTLRRKDEKRREKRLARQERKAAERKAKEEKLRRLKNAKREEMEKKLKQVKAVLGAKEEAAEVLKDAPVDEAALMKLLEGDYDPEKFEKSMQEAFGDDFYSKEELEWKSDEDVERTLKNDGDVEFLDAEAGSNDGDGYSDEEDHVQEYDEVEEQHKAGEPEGEDVDDDDEYYEDGMDAEEREKETELERKLRQKMEDKLYELDYEDIVAGMPTRFKYRQVEPNNYGLTTEEILLARDSTLKQYVSLKKMAPYREDEEYQVNARKRRKFRELLQQDIEEVNQQLKEQGITINDNHGDDGSVPEGSRKKRKRRRLKKGANESSGGAESINAEPENEKQDDAQASDGGETGEEGKKKRRRKKKGKKSNSKGELEAQVDSVKAETFNEMDSSGSVPAAPAKTKGDGQPKDSEIKATTERSKEKRKKKAKKKKVAVEGISATRLASYGL